MNLEGRKFIRKINLGMNIYHLKSFATEIRLCMDYFKYAVRILQILYIFLNW